MRFPFEFLSTRPGGVRRLTRAGMVSIALSTSAGAVHAGPACPAVPARTSMPIEATPQPVNIDEWRKREEQIKQKVKDQDLSATRLVFIGDSITQSWDPALWEQFWGASNPVNLGLWGDITQGVLWRLNNGEWNKTLRPKLAVILIGTNNANWHSRPEDTALGIAEIVRFVRSRSPTTKILLLGILPRGADAGTPERSVNAEVNRIIRGCADGKAVVYLEPGQAMVGPDGRISPQVMFDFLHPTMVGYGILGGAIHAQIDKMMSD